MDRHCFPFLVDLGKEPAKSFVVMKDLLFVARLYPVPFGDHLRFIWTADTMDNRGDDDIFSPMKPSSLAASSFDNSGVAGANAATASPKDGSDRNNEELFHSHLNSSFGGSGSSRTGVNVEVELATAVVRETR